MRNIETTRKKLINAHYAVLYNEFCLSNNLLPTFTNIRLRDRAVQQSDLTLSFRRKLLENEVETKKRLLNGLSQQLSDTLQAFHDLNADEEVKRRAVTKIDELLIDHEETVRTRTINKLSSLYGDRVVLPNPSDNYINLSSHDLTEDQKDLLNLGLNCNFYPRRSQQDKKAELELLYQQICDHHKAGRIVVKADIQEQLLAEGTKSRGNTKSRLITKRLRDAAQALRNNKDLIIRRADKSSIFVLLDRTDYLHKVKALLDDTTKFKQLSRNPTDKVKKDLNALIDAANAENGGVTFTKLTGEYEPGYFYGNPKTHKPDNPLRPIISQIPTPTYGVAKQLNSLLDPYIPRVCSLKSSSEFLEILKVKDRQGILASLDVSSLFTNVPIDETIGIILNCVYHNDSIPAPRLPSSILKKMLELCTKSTPFRSPEGKLFCQVDGVAMGSPLGVLFAEAYMSHIEALALSDMDKKPFIYCRYIDDIFVDVADENQLDLLKMKLKDNSVLDFTSELSVGNKIPFLDVNVDGSNGKYVTSVYRKPTDSGKCLNGNSECPETYKRSVIRAYIHRALRHCATWALVHQELSRVKQLLVNNYFTLTDIDKEIRHQLHRHFLTSTAETKNRDRNHTGDPDKADILLFYKGNMSTGYKAEEKALRDIVSKNCTAVRPSDEIKLTIYYQSPRVSSLIMNNNMSKESSKLKATNVIYEFKCPFGECAHQTNSSYIGHTTTTLSRRITMHLQDGAPKQHVRAKHHETLTRSTMVENTNILVKNSNRRKLKVLEAVYIRDKDPLINRQSNMIGTIWLCDSKPLVPRL